MSRQILLTVCVLFITSLHAVEFQNQGENCWWGGDDFCGDHGVCCRLGWYDLEAGCDGLTGCFTKHCCVDSRLNIHEANTPRSECDSREASLATCELDRERDPLGPQNLENQPLGGFSNSPVELITGCQSKCCYLDGICVPFKCIMANQYCKVNKITLSDFAPDHSHCAALALHDPLCTSNIFTYSKKHYNCECVIKHDCTFVNDPTGIFLVEEPNVGTLQIEGLEYGVFQVMDTDIKPVTGLYPEPTADDFSRCTGYMLEQDGGRHLCRSDPFCRFIDENCYPFEVVLPQNWCYKQKVELASHVDSAVECASLARHDSRCETKVFVYSEKHQRCECLCDKCERPWYTTVPYPGFGVYQITDQWIRKITTTDKGVSVRMIAQDTIAQERKYPGYWKEWQAESADLCGVKIWMAPECMESELNKKKYWWSTYNSMCGCSLNGQYTLLQYDETDSGETDSTTDNTVSYLSKFKHVRNRMAIGTNIYEVRGTTHVVDN